MRRWLIDSITAFAIAIPTVSAGQTGAISGSVAQAASGAPLAGAAVVLAGTGRGALVDTLGRFTITDLRAQSHRVEVRRQGYEPQSRLVVVRAGETTFVSFALALSTQVLGAVRTEATAADRELFLTRPSLGTTSLNSRSVTAVPRLGEADIIRVIQLLPGVGARNDFSTGFNVHGGEADQNLILIDGYPIYNPFHLGGLFSTFMDATVRDVTLMTGAFPARYGGRLSSVLDVRSAAEGRPGLHGSAELSLLGSTAMLSAPISDRGSWLVAARRTYADLVVGAFSDEVLPYHFYDLHGHAAYRLPGDWWIALTGYGGNDVLDADLSEVDDDSVAATAAEGNLFFRWGNSVVGATLSKTITGGPGADSVVSCNVPPDRRSRRTWMSERGPRVSVTPSSTGGWGATSRCTRQRTSSRRVTSCRRIAWRQKTDRRRRGSGEPTGDSERAHSRCSPMTCGGPPRARDGSWRVARDSKASLRVTDCRWRPGCR